jgi:hypothetical protein
MPSETQKRASFEARFRDPVRFRDRPCEVGQLLFAVFAAPFVFGLGPPLNVIR